MLHNISFVTLILSSLFSNRESLQVCRFYLQRKHQSKFAYSLLHSLLRTLNSKPYPCWIVRLARRQIFLYQTIQLVVRAELARASFFWDQEVIAFCEYSSHHLNGWVPMSSAGVFFQETSARYWTLALRQNEYLPQVSGQVERRWVQERAAVSLTTHSICTWGWHRHNQGRTSDLQDQAFRYVPPQHARILPWEQQGILCTHSCSPPSHQAEGAAQEVPSACQSCCEMVQGIEESPRSPKFSRHRLDECRCNGPQGGDWAPPIDAPRSLAGSWQGNHQVILATEEPVVRQRTVPMGSRLPQDAQAWLVDCSKWSSCQSYASMNVDVLPGLSWAT